ncbi:uridine kinase [uncultured Jatrophihabitans sp.]|uniref:uridine kinase n=1 Tax=uncultured Jatrophihabitans sp. TaxID=1610747 RepID=UPI0035CB7874
MRVALDGPPAAEPDVLAAALLEPLRALSRPAVHVRAASFWHDASLRLEHGREDVESYLSWLDAESLRREVLVAAVESGHYLPSLRDPVSNRSTRASTQALSPDSVVLVSGALLLGRGLPFDRVVELQLSTAALLRRTARAERWTLPAFESYAETVRPAELADVVIRPEQRTPAVCGLP